MLFNALFFLTGLLISSTKNSLELSITELTAISTLIVALLLTFSRSFFNIELYSYSDQSVAPKILSIVYSGLLNIQA